MPIHDWTRVPAGIWHAQHVGWTAQLQGALNDGRLPKGYYALAEQDAGPFGPDVLALERKVPDGTGGRGDPDDGGVAVAPAPPKTRIIDRIELDHTTRRRRTLAIRHVTDDRVVALLELVSPGNKAAYIPFETFVRKVAGALHRGIHVLVVDLFPRTPRDRDGIHAAIVAEACPGGATTAPPDDEPLTLASYVADSPLRVYVEPTAVGRPLADMPLFVTPDLYVDVPLESTYTAAFATMPEHLRVAVS